MGSSRAVDRNYWFIEWRAAGFLRRDTAAEWRDAGFTPVEAARWYKLDVPGVKVAREFREAGLDARTYSNWRAVVPDPQPAVILAWRSMGVSSDEACQWAGIGVDVRLVAEEFWATDPRVSDYRDIQWDYGLFDEVVTWATMPVDRRGHHPVVFRQWARLGVDTDAALHLLAIGVGPRDYERAIVNGVSVNLLPYLLASGERTWVRWGRRLTDLKVTPGTLNAWLALGQTVESIVEWTELDISPTEASGWLALGAGDVREVAEWRKRKFTLESAGTWIQQGVSSSKNAVRWKTAGVSPDVAGAWESTGLSFKECQAWREFDHSPDCVREWREAGFENPRVALDWALKGFSPEEGARWTTRAEPEPLEIGVDDRPEPAARDSRPIQGGEGTDGPGMSPSIAMSLQRTFSSEAGRLLAKHGIPLEKTDRWRFAPVSLDVVRELVSSLEEKENAQAWIETGIAVPKWPQWWLFSGGNPRVAEKWFSSGSSVERLILLREQHAFRPEEAEEWDRLGVDPVVRVSDLIRASQQSRQTSRPDDPGSQGRSEHDGRMGAAWRPAFAGGATSDWLDEVLAKAHLLEPFLSKDVADGREYWDKKRKVFITLSRDGDVITGTVGDGSNVSTTSFYATSLAPMGRLNGELDRLVFGLVISWFIDCTIVLQNVRLSRGLFSTGGGIGRRRWPDHRYAPTTRFMDGITSIRSGRGAGLALHIVQGHIRTLPVGWTPSDKALNRAPEFLRRRMGRNQTFVREHHRGVDDKRLRTYRDRVARFSALAHALAALPRY